MRQCGPTSDKVSRTISDSSRKCVCLFVLSLFQDKTENNCCTHASESGFLLQIVYIDMFNFRFEGVRNGGGHRPPPGTYHQAAPQTHAAQPQPNGYGHPPPQ